MERWLFDRDNFYSNYRFAASLNLLRFRDHDFKSVFKRDFKLKVQYDWIQEPDVYAYYNINPRAGKWASFSFEKGFPYLKCKFDYGKFRFTTGGYYCLGNSYHTVAYLIAFNRIWGNYAKEEAFLNASLRGIREDRIYGETLLFTSLEYRFPIKRMIGRKLATFYLEYLGAGLFLDHARIWKGKDSQIFITFGIELKQRIYAFGKIPLVLGLGIKKRQVPKEPSKAFFNIGYTFNPDYLLR
jgi:hypothetical protein